MLHVVDEHLVDLTFEEAGVAGVAIVWAVLVVEFLSGTGDEVPKPADLGQEPADVPMADGVVSHPLARR